MSRIFSPIAKNVTTKLKVTLCFSPIAKNVAVDVVPLMKTAGVVKYSEHMFYWIKVFLKLPFAVSFSVLYEYMYL